MTKQPELLPFSLQFVEWQVSYELLGDLHFRGFAGSAVRGTFGHALKDIGCLRRHGRCDGCLAPQRCVYSQVFEGSSCNNPERSSNHSPPYVVDVENFPNQARKGESVVVLFRFFGPVISRTRPL